MNETIKATVVLKLSQVPFEINDVILLVNCRDMAGEIKAGSCFIYSTEPLILSSEEKMILLAEIVKRLGIEMQDAANFLSQQWGLRR